MILDDHFDLAAVHAALAVHVVEVEVRAELHVLPELLGGTGKGDRLAEDDLVVADALGARERRRGERKRHQQCAEFHFLAPGRLSTEDNVSTEPSMGLTGRLQMKPAS